VFEWPDEALRFLDGQADCLHIIGQPGMGKTALLRQLQHRLAQTGVAATYTYVPPNAAADVGAVQIGQLTLLDETDRLPPRQLISLLKRIRAAGGRCALGTHRDQRRLVRRAGMTLVHLRLRRRGLDAARCIFEGRLRLALGDQLDAYVLAAGAAGALLWCSRGNSERILQLGYEIFEDLDYPRSITHKDVFRAHASLKRCLRSGAE